MSDTPSTDEIRVETTAETAVVRTIRVEVPAERVRVVFDRTFDQLGRGARVKGFRPGKVPRSVLQKIHGAAAVEEAERHLVSATLADALELAGVQPVTEPDVDATPPVNGEAFVYSVRVEVKPVIELPELEGLPAERPPIEVDEAEIDARIEQMREGSAPLVEVEEGVAAAEGHTLSIDFEGRVGGELFDGGAGKEMSVEIGASRLVPGFEEQLVGARSGEERSVEVTFPDDYGEESLRGKEAVFAVTVRSVRCKQLPELDDEFAKDVGEESLDGLREKLRDQMAQAAQQQAQAAVHRSLMDALIERCEFEVPPGLVERQLHSQMSSMQRQFEGKVAPEVLRTELARIHEDGRPGAERRVREALLLGAVAEKAELSVAAEEIEARLAEIAQAQGADPDQISAMAEAQGWKSAIEAELLDAKALDFLAARANVEGTTDT